MMATDLKKFAQVLQQDPTGGNEKAILYAPLIGIEIGSADRRAGKLLEVMLREGLLDEKTTIGEASDMLNALGWWVLFWQCAVERDSKDGATLDVAQLRARVVELARKCDYLDEIVKQCTDVLLSVKDYGLNPKSQRVNAGAMTLEERLFGAAGQAEQMLDEMEQLRRAYAKQKESNDVSESVESA